MDDFLQSGEVTRPKRAHVPPFDVWLRAVAIMLVIFGGLLGYTTFVQTPLLSSGDERYFADQMASLERQAQQINTKGKTPVKLVFIGTSRSKNVAFDNAVVRKAAIEAGLNRPVASTVLAVNWGGFERLVPAMPRLLAASPDYLFIQPELLYEDFTSISRAKIGLRYFQQMLRGQSFLLFDTEKEFNKAACSGFELSAQDRSRKHNSWIYIDPAAKGPKIAAHWLREFVNENAKVLIAPIPVHPELAKIRSDKIELSKIIELHGLSNHEGISILQIANQLDEKAYCDYAHIAPEQARVWLSQFFKKLIGDDVNLHD